MTHATKQPPQALTVVNGHVLVAYTHVEDGGNGTYAHGVGLFAAPDGEYHTHAVWAVVYNDDQDTFTLNNGSYCHGFPHALAVYKQRGGQLGPVTS